MICNNETKEVNIEIKRWEIQQILIYADPKSINNNLKSM